MLKMAAQHLGKHGLTNFTSISGLAESLPFADAAFDVVFMVTMLGEVPDRATAIREVARILRPGGRFSSTEAAGDQPREAHRIGCIRGTCWPRERRELVGLVGQDLQLQQAAIVGVMPRQSAGQRFPAKS
jgi:SAM-dependent methyltransferase